MGWVNYVKVPSLKMLVEVDRGLNSVLYEEFNTDINEEVIVDLEKNYSDLSLNDLYNLINYYDKSTKIFYKDELFLYWLESRKISYDIIHESEYYNNKEEYDEWFVLERK